MTTKSTNSKIAIVAVIEAAWSKEGLSYVIPDGMDVSVGSLVEVTLRSKPARGVVLEVREVESIEKLERIVSVRRGRLEEWQIRLMKKVADYYMTGIGKCAGLAVPKMIWEDWIPARELRIKCRKEAVMEAMSRDSKLRRALLAVADNGSGVWSQIKSEYGLAAKDMVKIREICEVVEGDIELSSYQTDMLEDGDSNGLKKLTKQQKEVWQELEQGVGKAGKYLLWGITGSGKTEVYLHLARKIADKGEQTLILVPEITLTPQMVRYFSRVFGDRVAVIHSKLNAREKARQWWRIYEGSVDIVIGSRSSLFYPFRRLGAVVVDEEHELSSYKNGESPRYSARRVALELAGLHSAVKVLGSATPSAESWYAEQSGILKLLEMNERV